MLKTLLVSIWSLNSSNYELWYNTVNGLPTVWNLSFLLARVHISALLRGIKFYWLLMQNLSAKIFFFFPVHWQRANLERQVLRRRLGSIFYQLTEESNRWRLGDKRECYLCAMLSPLSEKDKLDYFFRFSKFRQMFPFVQVVRLLFNFHTCLNTKTFLSLSLSLSLSLCVFVCVRMLGGASVSHAFPS